MILECSTSLCFFFWGQTAFRFHHCPPVLVLQLKRFQYTRWSWAQCQTHLLHPLFIQVSSTPLPIKLSFQVSRKTQQPCLISVGEPGSQPLPDGVALSRSWRNGASHGHHVRIVSPPEIGRKMVFIFLMRGPAAAMSDVIMGGVLQQP